MDCPTRTLTQLDGFTDISTVIFDELALAPAHVLETVSFCMRGKNIHPHIYAMTTPRMFSWLNRYIEENAQNIDIIRATTLDNVFISQEQIELMKSTCANEKMLRQELYGEIVEDSDAGAIFTFDILNRTNTLKKDLLYNIRNRLQWSRHRL
nr:MAG TPA: large terminase [Caudoviricetes sp.]